MDGKIILKNPELENGYIRLVNVSGQVLGRFELDGNSTHEIAFSQATGIYIITIQTNKTHVSRKILIK